MSDYIPWAPQTDGFLSSEVRAGGRPSQGDVLHTSLPANSLRLLKILQPEQSDGDMISCQLIVFSLKQSVTYAALSYAWGRPPDSCHILINGIRTAIRKNLYRFLQHYKLCRSGTAKWLWIDALCIDQTDLQERAKQVQVMPLIYSWAEHVIIWLGPEYDASQEAMDSLSQVSKRDLAKTVVATPNGRTLSDSFKLLCMRPYWTRLWVFQEVFLASKKLIMCGSSLVQWEHFVTMLVNSEAQYTRLEDQTSSIRNAPAYAIINNAEMNYAQDNLFDLIVATQELKCVEPRDRVFALLGLGLRGCKGITPDYNVPLGVMVTTILRMHYKTVQAPHDVLVVKKHYEQLLSIIVDRHGTTFGLVGSTSSPQESMNRYLAGSVIRLWWAVRYGHNTGLRKLPGHEKMAFDSWLSQAAAEDDLSVVQLLLEYGADPNMSAGDYTAPSSDGTISTRRSHTCALYSAVANGNVALVKLLLGNGARFHILSGTSCGGIAVAAAIRAGHTEIVSILADRGAIIETSTSDAATQDAEMVRVDRGATIETSTSDAATHDNEMVMLQTLSAEEVFLNLRDHKNPVIAAATCGHMHVATSLLDSGIKINIDFDMWKSYQTFRNAYYALFDLLLDRRADGDPDWSSHFAPIDVEPLNRPLCAAAVQYDIPMLMLLVEFGTPLCIDSGSYHDKASALVCAIFFRRGCTKVIDFLIEAGALSDEAKFLDAAPEGLCRDRAQNFLRERSANHSIGRSSTDRCTLSALCHACRAASALPAIETGTN